MRTPLPTPFAIPGASSVAIFVTCVVTVGICGWTGGICGRTGGKAPARAGCVGAGRSCAAIAGSSGGIAGSWAMATAPCATLDRARAGSGSLTPHPGSETDAAGSKHSGRPAWVARLHWYLSKPLRLA